MKFLMIDNNADSLIDEVLKNISIMLKNQWGIEDFSEIDNNVENIQKIVKARQEYFLSLNNNAETMKMFLNMLEEKSSTF